jgi:oligogalacturonide transport system substrate-binding protein
MAAGKTFESKLGKQYYPVVLEHQDTLALLNSYMIQKYNIRPSMRKPKILLQQRAVGGILPDV